MRSTLLTSALIIFACVPGRVVEAQLAQQLSVSPTLFEMSAQPEQTWRSSIRVVNPNAYDLTVHIAAVNFAPRGEGGDGTLLPVLETEQEGLTLAEWIKYDREPVTIPPERTIEIPFTVQIPHDAAPGGHFAAFMVGTKPPESDDRATKLRTSQVVTSLFFVRVAGDVVEAGEIREFRTEKRLYSRPEAEFHVRFENKGNVHLRPQGDIKIYNMWGQERGMIPINRQSHFGNVLPDSIRKFNFSWRSEWSFADMGRYRAITTLAYGQDERRFVTSTTYFWVVPLGPLFIGLLILVGLISSIVWLIRLYVRRMLLIAGVRIDGPPSLVNYHKRSVRATNRGDIMITPPAPAVITAHSNKTDSLRTRIVSLVQTGTTLIASQMRVVRFDWRLIAGLTLLLVLVVVLIAYLGSALTPQRSYEVTYLNSGTSTSVASDQIMYEDQRTEPTVSSDELEAVTLITIINSSGVAGAGARVALELEAKGYAITGVETDFNEAIARTRIIYPTTDTEAALALSKILNNALLSAYENDSDNATVTIYLGADVGVER